MNQKQTIFEFVENLHELYSIPSVALKVIQQLTDPEIKINHLSETILNDQALTADLLKVANSGYFNFPEPVTTLNKAIVLIGLKLTKEIAVSFAVKSLIKGMANVKGVNYLDLWQHAGICAIFAKKISDHFKADSEIQFISGLLHDVGILVELLYDPDFYGDILKKSIEKNEPYFELENTRISFNHADVGHALLKSWNIPAHIATPVGMHHSMHDFNGESDYFLEGMILHLANIFTHKYLENNEHAFKLISGKNLQELELTDQELNDLYNNLVTQIDEEKERFSLLEF